MGINCSCLRNGSLLLENTLEVDDRKSSYRAFANPLSSSRKISVRVVQVSNQALIRACHGFLVRKRTLPAFRAFQSTKKYITFTPISDHEFMQRDLFDYINSTLGSFEYSEVLSEGIPVFERGPVLLSDKSLYKGEWNSLGLEHGRGIKILPEGSIYEGYFYNGKFEGKGRLTQADKSFYEGEFHDDKISGYGKFSKDGISYEGHFLNYMFHGKGKEMLPDGSYYEGNYLQGKKEGLGFYRWEDGRTYTGQFKGNSISGEGELLWPDGQKYLGKWKDGKMHGKGCFYWPDGRVYEGRYFEDKKHGDGKFTWPTGQVFVGKFRNGLQHGVGNMTKVVDGVSQSMDGVWENGKFSHWCNTD